jgi:hypothetical protein
MALLRLPSLGGPSGQSLHHAPRARLQRIRGANGANALPNASDLRSDIEVSIRTTFPPWEWSTSMCPTKFPLHTFPMKFHSTRTITQSEIFYPVISPVPERGPDTIGSAGLNTTKVGFWIDDTGSLSKASVCCTYPDGHVWGPLESPDEGNDILLEAGARRLYGKRDR